MSETEKALFKRMKGVMKKEVEELPNTNSRRGFLQALATGGVTLGVIGSGQFTSAEGTESCTLPCQNCLVCCETACQKSCQNCQATCLNQCQTACMIACEGCINCQTGISP
jgi:hypothetical protein